MASQGYYDWLNAGRPYTLIRPAKAVQAKLRGNGLTVYDYPNDAHLTATTPEDHTPFSTTGWPGTNRRWKARALDVMPRSDSATHRKENADIARQLIRDRDAGVSGAMWIKYLNWTDENGVCRQERWMDASAPLRRTTRSSTDKGHIHISGRSDVDDDDRADNYDPIGRMNGEDDMSVAAEQAIARMDGRIAALFYGMSGNPYGDGAMHDEPNQVGRALARLEAEAAADKARDEASLAAINKLVALIGAAGGNVTVTPIVEAIQQVGDKVRAKVEELQALLEESRARELAALTELATVKATAEANLSPAERAALDGTT